MPRDFRGMAKGRRFAHFDFQSSSPQTLKGWTQQVAGSASASGGVHDRQISFPVQHSSAKRTEAGSSQLFNGAAMKRTTNLLCELIALDFHGSGARKIFVPQHVSGNPLEIRQTVIARRNLIPG